MAEGHSNNDIDDIEMAEEEDGWEYYDDNDVLPDFWQDFITNENDFAQPLDMWLRHFTKPFGQLRTLESSQNNMFLIYI